MPTGTTLAPKQGFWISFADANGAKSSVEQELSPYPSTVSYPTEDLGTVQETADGRVVVQVTGSDPRRRTWTWKNYGLDIPIYERQYRLLLSLRARHRQARGQSPYVYVYDGVTRSLLVNRSITVTGGITLSGTTVTVPSLAAQVNSAHLASAWVEVLPGTSPAQYERRRVVSSGSATTLTLESAFSSNTIGTSQLLITWTQPMWFKVRVLDTTRTLSEENSRSRFTDTLFRFVIEDDLADMHATVGP